MAQHHDLTTDDKANAAHGALFDNEDTREPGLLTMKRHYYGLDGRMGDKRKIELMWKGGALAFFILGLGCREIFTGLIHSLFK